MAFTIRPTEDEDKLFDKLADALGIATKAKAVTFAVREYFRLKTRCADLEKELAATRNELFEHRKRVQSFLSSFDALNDLRQK